MKIQKYIYIEIYQSHLGAVELELLRYIKKIQKEFSESSYDIFFVKMTINVNTKCKKFDISIRRTAIHEKYKYNHATKRLENICIYIEVTSIH